MFNLFFTAQNTPRNLHDGYNDPNEGSTSEKDINMESSHVGSKLNLDTFLTKNTSEDNASFEKIMEVTREKHREKFAWLFEKEKEQEKNMDDRLALPSSQFEQIEAAKNQSANVDTWTYTPRNALMYPPDGADLSVKELIERKGKHGQEINHSNTRFQADPFDSYSSKQAMLEAVQSHSEMQKAVGKVGVDGKIEQTTDTPMVRGYGFIAPPSPAPGKCLYYIRTSC